MCSSTSRPRRKPRPKYKSKFEGKVADALESKGKAIEYEVSTLPYRLDLLYKPDWKVDNSYYIEAKGLFDYTERRKMLAVIRDNPHIDVRMCFMRDNKLRRNTETRYSDWCKSHGIRYSIFPDLPID